VLGRGASGEVYEAAHVETGEPAAVKLLRRELLADPVQVARFLREARASGALSSPHVVHVLDASLDGADLPYLAMERLHGETLAEQLRREPKLGSPAVVELTRQVGAGIDAAAVVEIVHRDLKPQNLFAGSAGWQILDFGVARLADSTGTLTQGGVVGTPAYMAPEQAQGESVDSRADIYALAAVAYRCLTGRHPFTGGDTPALLYAVVHAMPPRPGALAELPGDVDACLAIGLAKSPADRFASGGELATALADALAGQLQPALRRRGDALARRQPWEAG
jgi:serine/threonine-protein kinase